MAGGVLPPSADTKADRKSLCRHPSHGKTAFYPYLVEVFVVVLRGSRPQSDLAPRSENYCINYCVSCTSSRGSHHNIGERPAVWRLESTHFRYSGECTRAYFRSVVFLIAMYVDRGDKPQISRTSTDGGQSHVPSSWRRMCRCAM